LRAILSTSAAHLLLLDRLSRDLLERDRLLRRPWAPDKARARGPAPRATHANRADLSLANRARGWPRITALGVGVTSSLAQQFPEYCENRGRRVLTANDGPLLHSSCW